MTHEHIWPIFAAPLLAAGDWLLVAADAMPDALREWPVAAVGSTGILAWYLWYTTCRALPAITKEQREERAAMQSHYEKVLEDVRESNCASNDRLTNAIDRLAERVEANNAARP
jgi:hypothetical protein